MSRRLTGVRLADMADVQVKLNPQEIKRQLTGPGGAVALDLLKRGRRVQNAAQRLAPVDQGGLRASITTEVRGSGEDLLVRVGTALKYGIYVEKGTGIYAGKGYITAKGGGLMRWPNKNNSGSGNRRYSGGKTSKFVYAKKVKGQKAQPFLEPALKAAR